MTTLQVIRGVSEVRAFTSAHHAADRRVALVPTMGALHVGHQQLMRTAAEHAEVVVASIFVNPTQFAPGEDLDTYPRDEAGDLEKLAEAGCAAVFLPTVEEMYPAGAETRVSVGALASRLCGVSRPGHFTGVATVVLKLFNITRCDVALFGEKDYQQLAVIRRMVRDMDVPVKVVGAAIVREANGLALSSRNARLSPKQREAATVLHRALLDAEALFLAGARDPSALAAVARATILAESSARLEYVECVDAASLKPVEGMIERPVVLALAAHFGDVRLIDNAVLDDRKFIR